MATYMLCGFANFASIGIQIGGIGSLAPNQRINLSKFQMTAVLGGTLASLLLHNCRNDSWLISINKFTNFFKQILLIYIFDFLYETVFRFSKVRS